MVAASAEAGLAVPSTAHADGDPAGTIVLASGPTTSPKAVSIEAATPNSVLFRDERGLVLQRRDKRTSTVLTTSGGQVEAAGSLVLYADYTDGRRYWYNTANGTKGVAPSSWDGPAPSGGLIVTRIFDGPKSGPTAASVIRVTLQDAVSGGTRVLAEVPYDGADGNFFARSGPNGVVVYYDHAFEASGDSFVGYVSYAGGVIKSYDLGAAGDFNYISCVANASTVACTEAGGDQIYATPIGGTALTSLGSYDGSSVALSSAAAGWLSYQPDPVTGKTQFRLESVPLDGGSVSVGPVVYPSGFDDALTDRLVSDGTTFFVNQGKKPSTAGVYSTPDADTTPSRVVALGAAPYLAADLAITPGGRVVFTDNRTTDDSLWEQALTRTADTVTSHGESLLSNRARGASLSVSGARTGYGSSTGGYVVSSPLQPSTYQPEYGAISGTRAVFPSFFNTDGAPLVDLNTTVATSTAAFRDPGANSVLWGDYDVFTKTDGSIWRKNLSSAASATRILPAAASTTVQSLAVWGDWVAVGRSSNASTELTTKIVNTRTGIRRQANDLATSAGAAGYVIRGKTLYSWDGSRSISVDGTKLVATASIMAWVGRDGRPRAAPLPWTVPDPPRSLGNPLAPSTIAAGSGWRFDLPTSASLSSCRVDLTRGATLVRSLPCDPAYTNGGDASVVWDTRNGQGDPAPIGTYTWKVVASNDDGPLQLGDGSAGTVSGRFTLTRAG